MQGFDHLAWSVVGLQVLPPQTWPPHDRIRLHTHHCSVMASASL